jgi:transcription elongation GreA/GreB family factor
MKHKQPTTALRFALLALLALPGLVRAQPGSERFEPRQDSAAQNSSPQTAENDIPRSQWTTERVENPPRRELKIEVATKPREIQLRPELVEQKFLAEVRIAQPVLDSHLRMFRRGAQRQSFLPEELDSLRYINNFILLEPGLIRAVSSAPQLSTNVAGWLKHVPADRITVDERAFFESPAIDQGLLSFYSDPTAGSSFRSAPDQMRGQAFYVFGRSEKECEARAKTLLTILDYGFSRPIQQHLLTQQSHAKESLEKALAEQKAVQDESAKVAKELTSYSDYSEDILPGLRQQQMALEVDLAGTMARIEACNLLLAKTAENGGLTPGRRVTVEDTKIQAEISLAGFQSSRAKLDEFVKKARTKVELTAKKAEFGRRSAELQRKVRDLQTHFWELESHLVFYAPIGVVDDTVVVHPLQWTTR